MSVLESLDKLLESAADNGLWVRTGIASWTGLTTDADTSSGYINAVRMQPDITVPSMAGGIYGMYVTYLRAAAGRTGMYLAALEYDLGSLAVSSNVFTDGVAMPSKRCFGTSLQTATLLPMVVVTTSLTGSAPTLTITYTNQAGTGSRTATVALPASSAAASAFSMMPHLQSGDMGVRDITGMSRSAGTGGVVHVYGLLPLAWALPGPNTGAVQSISPLGMNYPMHLCEAGEVIRFYRFSGTAANGGQMFWSMSAVAETE